MFKKMIGLAGGLVLAGAAPAFACNTGCVTQPTVVYGTPAPYHHHVAPPQPRYYVNQGPTYTGPATYAPAPVYQEHGVTGHYPYVSSYPQPYTGGPYADPNNHYSYGSSPNQGPVVHRYHNLPATYAPAPDYSAAPVYHRPAPRYRKAPRYHAPRYSQAPRYYAPRFRAAPRYRAAPVYHRAPRYSVAPRYRAAPRYYAAPPRFRAAPRYGYRGPAYAPRVIRAPRVVYAPRAMRGPRVGMGAPTHDPRLLRGPRVGNGRVVHSGPPRHEPGISGTAPMPRSRGPVPQRYLN